MTPERRRGTAWVPLSEGVGQCFSCRIEEEQQKKGEQQLEETKEKLEI